MHTTINSVVADNNKKSNLESKLDYLFIYEAIKKVLKHWLHDTVYKNIKNGEQNFQVVLIAHL